MPIGKKTGFITRCLDWGVLIIGLINIVLKSLKEIVGVVIIKNTK